MAADGSNITTTKVLIRDLRRRFAVRARTYEALAGVDLDVAQGEFLAIVGPSVIDAARPRNFAFGLKSEIPQEVMARVRLTDFLPAGAAE